MSIGRLRDAGTVDLQRWVVCCLAALSLTGLTAVVYAFGVFFDPIQRTFDVSSGRVSMIFSVHTFVTFAFGALVGFVADRYRSDGLLLFGAVCWALGLGGTAAVGSYAGVILFFGVFVAFGFGLAYIVIYATIARWFDRRLGLAMSILSVGFGLGGLVGPPVAEILLGYVRWNEAYLVLAVPTTAAIVATSWAFFVSDPVEVALDGGSTPAERETSTEAGARADAGGGGDEKLSPLETLASVRFLVVTVGFTLGFYAFYALLVHYVPYALETGLSRRTAALGLGLIGGASIPARLGAGYLSDLYGRISVLFVGYALVCVAVAALIVADGSLAFLALALLFGLGSGATSALYSPIIADMFGDADVGKMLGLTSLSFGIAGVAGPATTGFLFETTGSYSPALAVAVVCSVAGALTIAVAYSEWLAGRTLV